MCLLACGSLSYAFGPVPPTSGNTLAWKYTVLFVDGDGVWTGPFGVNYAYASPSAAASGMKSPSVPAQSLVVALTGFNDVACPGGLAAAPGAEGALQTCSGYFEGYYKVGAGANVYRYAAISRKSVLSNSNTCPTNSVASAEGCSCSVGYRPDSGSGTVCEAYTCQASAAVEASYVMPTGSLDNRFFCETGTGADRTARYGCVSKFDPSFSAPTYSGGNFVLHGTETPTATMCPQVLGNGLAEGAAMGEPVVSPCPTGQGPVTINGITTCAKSGTGTAEAPSTTASSPSGTTTSSGSTTCTAGACTTTTTTTDQTGAVIGSVSTTQTLGGFCAGSGAGTVLCGGGGGGGDSSIGQACAAGSATQSCEGDAVQCAIALEQYKRNCQLFDSVGATKTKGDEAIARGDTKASDHPGANGNIVTTNVGSAMDTTDLIGGSCIGDEAVTVFGSSTVVMPWSKLCTPAQWLGNLLVALTSLAWVFIAFKRD